MNYNEINQKNGTNFIKVEKYYQIKYYIGIYIFNYDCVYIFKRLESIVKMILPGYQTDTYGADIHIGIPKN